MSDNNIPFDIQTEIIKRLPVESLLRFRCVSKQWKSHISSTKFINDHHRINQKKSQRHLLVRHRLKGQVPEYTSIIDDDTFPNQKSSVTLPPPLNLMNDWFLKILSSVNGLLCFYGYHTELRTCMIVILNPTISKTIGIPIPSQSENAVFGFGFCRDSSDPKFVKIEDNAVLRGGVSCWKVDVFTLSSRVWKTVFNGWSPFGGCLLDKNHHVCIDGFIYWLATYYSYNHLNDKYSKSKGIVSFNLKSEEFGQVILPETLLQAYILELAEVNESLGVIGFYDDGVNLCGVWMMEFGTKSFAKMYSVKVPDQWLLHGVFWLRKNGEFIIEVEEDGKKKSRLEVYEPLSGSINCIGINGKNGRQRVSSYTETLLLLDQTSSIITFPKK